MVSGIVDSDIRLVRSAKLASEYDVLGTAIMAHLLALRFGGVVPRRDLESLALHTVRMYGHLYAANSRRMIGYRQAWIGKAFEYAVTDLFNKRAEPYWTLIRTGIHQAVCARRSSRVKVVDIDIDKLSCVRVSKECEDTADLIKEFQSFRILQDARTSLEGAALRFPGLEEKIDVLFCEREAEGPQYTVTGSLKVNRTAFLSERVRRDFQELPLDIGITVETPRFREVRFDAEIGAHIVYLPMNISREVGAWENATDIVEKALVEADRIRLIRWFARLFRPDTPGHFWASFLAEKIETDLDQVLEEIRQKVSGAPWTIRTAKVPVLLGRQEDAVLDLVN
jgi:hypothetical protein